MEKVPIFKEENLKCWAPLESLQTKSKASMHLATKIGTFASESSLFHSPLSKWLVLEQFQLIVGVCRSVQEIRLVGSQRLKLLWISTGNEHRSLTISGRTLQSSHITNLVGYCKFQQWLCLHHCVSSAQVSKCNIKYDRCMSLRWWLFNSGMPQSCTLP